MPPDVLRAEARVFRVVAAIIFLDNVLFTLVVPALPRFADRYGLSDSVAAAIFLAFPLAQLVTSPFAGRATDRLGRRPVMVSSMVLMLVATVAFAAADGVATLTVARALQGVAGCLTWTAGLAALSDTVPQERLGYRMALAETLGGGAGLLGPVVGGPAIDAFGTGWTFLAAAALPLVLLPMVVALPETRRPGTITPPLLPALRALARQPAARGGALGLAALAAVLALLEPLVPLDLDDRFGMSSTGVGLVFAAWFLAFFAVSPLAGRWSDRHGRRRPLLVGGVTAAAVLPLVPVAPGPVTTALALAVLGTALAVMAAPTGPLLTDAVDRAGMGGSYGLSSSVMTLVFALGYTVGPAMAAAARAVTSFTVIAVVAAAGLVAVAVAADRQLARAAHLVPAEDEPG
ncbi:MAG: MFS transporter [Thermoleophilia bacterium]|nr:MFS transporter [Thermoleophilia bacterium]